MSTPNQIASVEAIGIPVGPPAPLTPLASSLQAQSNGLSLVEYRGRGTVEHFGGTSLELAAMLQTAGVYDLGWRAFLRCSGRDRVRWLNGMVTNSVTTLAENTGCYAFVLNSQGRIQGDLDIYQRADALWLETDSSQVESLKATLGRYIIMDQVVLEPWDAWTVLGIAGPSAAKALEKAGLPVGEMSPLHLRDVEWRGHAVTVAAAYSPLAPLVQRYEIWIAPDAASDLWKALLDAGAVSCGVAAVEQLRILEGTPAYGSDISNRQLPQETNQVRALHFSKGCYLGQEIVERIRSRGNVHRTLAGFVLSADEDAAGEPAAATPLLGNGQPVGELTSIAQVIMPDGLPGGRSHLLALGYIRREALDSNAALTWNGHAVTPAALPFDFDRIAVQP